MLNRAEILKQQFNQSIELPWLKLLPESQIEEILVAEHIHYRNCLYTPIVTLWALLISSCTEVRLISSEDKFQSRSTEGTEGDAIHWVLS
jgi:hypothetical protein